MKTREMNASEGKASAPLSNLTIRLLTAAVVAPLILGALFMTPPWAFTSMVLLGTAAASFELGRMVAPDHFLGRAWLALASLGLVLGMVFIQDAPTLAFSFIGVTLGGLLVSLLSASPVEGAAGRMAWFVAGPLYIGLLLSTLVMLHQRPQGGSWVVLAMMLAWFGDTGGYFAGRAFGKHPLAPSISPKKTREGALGSVVGSTLAALLAHFWYLPSLPLSAALALALLGGTCGQLGDLCESLIKRSTGVKDSGRLIPGHGGILDRIDGLMFCGAITWAYAHYFT